MISRGPSQKRTRRSLDKYYNYRLINTRVKAGYTCEHLSKLTGISHITLRAYERLYCIPNQSNAKKLANILKTDINKLFPEKLKEICREIRLERKPAVYDSLDYYKKRLEEHPCSRRIKKVIFGLEKFVQLIENPIPIDSIPEGALIVEQDPSKDLIGSEMIQTLYEKIENLEYIEKEIIKLRFGLNNRVPLTLREIAKIIGFTRAGTRQKKDRALKQLQELLSNNLPFF